MDYLEKVEHAVQVGLMTRRLTDTSENRLLVLQQTYDTMTKDLPTTSDHLGLLQTIEGLMMELRRS